MPPPPVRGGRRGTGRGLLCKALGCLAVGQLLLFRQFVVLLLLTRLGPGQEDLSVLVYEDEDAADLVRAPSPPPTALQNILQRERLAILERFGGNVTEENKRANFNWCRLHQLSACMSISIRNGEIFVNTNLQGETTDARDVDSLELLRRALANRKAPLKDVDFNLDLSDGNSWFRDLPIWAYCRNVKSRDAGGIPVPDFTFWKFQKIVLSGLDRGDFAYLLQEFTKRARNPVYDWSHRQNALFWRGMDLRRGHLMLAVKTQKAAAMPGSSIAIDVEFVNYFGDNNAGVDLSVRPVPLFGFCDYKYLLHMEGMTYSSRLKFLLLCGSTVLMGPQDWAEWWFSALERPDVYVPLEPGYRNLSATLRMLEQAPNHAEHVALQGQALALDIFQPQCVDAYFEMVLSTMAELGYVWKDAPLGRKIAGKKRIRRLGYCDVCSVP